MKSTGLFGKNSGRVGGVVYSNYRGQQIVRSYQPQVKNPNTPGQVAQRSKFKLVSQVASVLSGELSLSFSPTTASLTPRNEWVKKIFPKVVYSAGEASLPIEEIFLTNSQLSATSLTATQSAITLFVPKVYWDISLVKAHFVVVGYNDGGDLTVVRSLDVAADSSQQVNDIITFTANLEGVSTTFGNLRVIGFAYEPSTAAVVNYGSLEVEGSDVTLSNTVSVYSLSNIRFSESLNVPIPRGV